MVSAEEQLGALIGDNISTSIVEFFCTKLAPGANRVLTEDQLTPLINELSQLIYYMLTNAVLRERQRVLLKVGEVMKDAVLPSIPPYAQGRQHDSDPGRAREA